MQRVYPVTGQIIQSLDAVMHGVEPPKQGKRVKCAVQPVKAEVGDQQEFCKGQLPRLAINGLHDGRRD
jgi:hypothetical protein